MAPRHCLAAAIDAVVGKASVVHCPNEMSAEFLELLLQPTSERV
jgi:hypothetical protein